MMASSSSPHSLSGYKYQGIPDEYNPAKDAKTDTTDSIGSGYSDMFINAQAKRQHHYAQSIAMQCQQPRFSYDSQDDDSSQDDDISQSDDTFLEAEEDRLHAQHTYGYGQPQGQPYYAAVVGRRRQCARFSNPKSKVPLYTLRADPTVGNRDMGELLARDEEFLNQKGDSPAQHEQKINVPSSMTIKSFVPVPPISTPRSGVGSVYTPLDPSKDQFRLLEILPAIDESAPLQAKLHVCGLAENVHAYYALSYTWVSGYEQEWKQRNPDRDPVIECDGVRMVLGLNLFLALCRLRRQEEPRVIWADAICINQSDDAERGQQVSRMGDIFRNAHEVTVWLGFHEKSQNPRTWRAFGGICSVVHNWAVSSKTVSLPTQPRFFKLKGGDIWEQDGNTPRPISAESATWVDVLALYDTKWFHRLWVVQEIALARQARVIWGDFEIPWQWIGLAAAIIRTNWNRIMPDVESYRRPPSKDRAAAHSRHDDSNDPPPLLGTSLRQVPPGVMNAYFMYRVSDHQQFFKPLRFSFCELLALTRQFECQDKRDSIFGLLGLPTSDGVNLHIKPNYAQTLSEVYRAVALAMVSTTANPTTTSLAFLSHVHHTDIRRRPAERRRRPAETFSSSSSLPSSLGDLPSWIPKWAVVGPQTLAPLDRSPGFSPSLNRPPQFELVTKDCINENCYKLKVKGIVLKDETVAAVSQQAPDLRRDDAQEEYGSNVKGAQMDVARLLKEHRYSTRDLERLAMTLVAGKGWYGTPVSDRKQVLSDFVDALLTGRLVWTLEGDAFGKKRTTTTMTTSGGGGGEEDGKEKEENSASSDLAAVAAAAAGSDSGAGSGSGQQQQPITMRDLRAMPEGNGNLVMDAVGTACTGRRLFTTSSGKKGVGPLEVDVGDKVCIIYGTPTPFIVREDKEGQAGDYLFVGECFIDDIMHGEALDDGKNEEEWIQLGGMKEWAVNTL